MLQQRPNTFAQTNLSLSFFACDKAADHTFRFVDNTRRNYIESAMVSVMGDISSVMRTSDSTVGFSTLAKS